MSKNQIRLKQGFGIFKDYPMPLHKNDLKLQAILIYALSRLEDASRYKKNKHNKAVFSNKEDKEFVFNFHTQLKEDLIDLVPTFDDLEKWLLDLMKKTKLTAIENIAYRQCTPLIQYHNTIVLESEKHFKNNSLWIPDLMAIALIQFWIVEYSNQTSTYHSFISKHNFQDVLDKYNKVSLENKKAGKECYIIRMYNIASQILSNLDKKKR